MAKPTSVNCRLYGGPLDGSRVKIPRKFNELRVMMQNHPFQWMVYARTLGKPQEFWFFRVEELPGPTPGGDVLSDWRS